MKRILHTLLLCIIAISAIAAPTDKQADVLVSNPSFSFAQLGISPLSAHVRHPTIKLATYTFLDHFDQPGPIIRRLVSFADQGVRVYILMHQFKKGEWPKGGHWLYLKELSFCHVHHFECRGVNMPSGYFHNKYVIVNNHTLLLSTGNYGASDSVNVRNFHYLTQQADVVSTFTHLFDHDWQHQVLSGVGVLSHLLSFVSSPSVILSPYNASEGLERFIYQTQHSLDIYAMYLDRSYFPAFYQLLLNLEKKGITVRVLTNAGKIGVGFCRLARSFKGVSVRYYHTQQQPMFVHAKVLIRDHQTAMLGSLNFSMSSIVNNREASVIINQQEPVHFLQQSFDQDWQHAGVIQPRPADAFDGLGGYPCDVVRHASVQATHKATQHAAQAHQHHHRHHAHTHSHSHTHQRLREHHQKR